jgi:hypothetical protein
MTKDATKDSRLGSGPASDNEIRYLARKMRVSVDEMRRLIAESSSDPKGPQPPPGLSAG